MGCEIFHVYRDHGVSGAKGRDKLPQFDMVMAWSVDRLGRSLQDLVTFLSEIHALKIELYLHQQGLDTTTPVGEAMFQVMGVFAEFERSMIQERVRAGLARAVASRFPPVMTPAPCTRPAYSKGSPSRLQGRPGACRRASGPNWPRPSPSYRRPALAAGEPSQRS